MGNGTASRGSGAPGNYLEPGRTIGYNYEIIERIGEGGMAVVYKARQKSLNRFVAIKALHPRFAQDESFIERFEAESGALASLSHANIVTIIDRGAEENIYFFVMEFVDGEDLDRKIIERKLKPADWRNVIAACRDALEYIHKRGVVHRDIKPSNILVSAEGQIKIGDFGIAHIVAGDQAVEITSSGPIGTTYYMSPEQASDPANVDARADIYSLAVAFYKMMTRSMPEGDFAPPSDINQEVPVAVDAVLLQAMAFDREERHRSVKEFCDELLRAMSQQALSLSAVFKMGQGPSSLYSGDDFRNKAGSPGQDKKGGSSDSRDYGKGTRAGKGLKEDSRQFGKGMLAGLPRVSPSPPTPTTHAATVREKTPVPLTMLKDKTPPPVPGGAVPPGEDHRKHVVMAVVGGILLLLTIGALAGGYFFLQQQAASDRRPEASEGPIVPLTDTRSPAQLRQEQEMELRRQRDAEVIRGVTPTPIITEIPNEDED